MNLKEILESGNEAYDVEIKGITADSRKVKKGFIFVALPGLKFNGVDFIDDALKAGAIAILCIEAAKIEN